MTMTTTEAKIAALAQLLAFADTLDFSVRKGEDDKALIAKAAGTIIDKMRSDIERLKGLAAIPKVALKPKYEDRHVATCEALVATRGIGPDPKPYDGWQVRDLRKQSRSKPDPIITNGHGLWRGTLSPGFLRSERAIPKADGVVKLAREYFPMAAGAVADPKLVVTPLGAFFSTKWLVLFSHGGVMDARYFAHTIRLAGPDGTWATLPKTHTEPYNRVMGYVVNGRAESVCMPIAGPTTLGETVLRDNHADPVLPSDHPVVAASLAAARETFAKFPPKDGVTPVWLER